MALANASVYLEAVGHVVLASLQYGSIATYCDGAGLPSRARHVYRRAVEERLAAQRAMTEQARAWHAKLAEDFALRAQCGASALSA